MNTPKAQNEINQREWEEENNWSTLYFSKEDSRTFVPKKNPKHGWTINFGSAAGSRWIYYLFIIFFIIGGILGATLTTVLRIMN